MGEYDFSRLVNIDYLDFQKAFDEIPYRRIKAKVRALGIWFDWVLVVGSKANSGRQWSD